MEARAFAVAASAGALASAAVCFWFTNKGTVVERPPDRRPQGDRAEAADGVLCNSPIRGPMEGFAAGSLGGADASDSSPMPSPLRNVRPKTLFGDPTDTCSEVALVDEHLRRLIKEGAFTLSDPGTDLSQYVQPASIDLPVHGPAFLVKEKVLPFKKRVRELLPSLTLEEKPLSGNGAVLLKGQTYLVYWGKVVLPPGSRGCLSPKSSIGRIDMMVRGVVDGCGLYDIVPGDGVPRELWLEISPQSFNVRLTDAIAVTQLMVFLPWDRVPPALPLPADAPADAAEPAEGGAAQARGVPRVAAFDVLEEQLCFDGDGRPLPLQLHKGAVVLSVCVPGAEQTAGFEAVATEEVVDLSRLAALDPRKFFRAVQRSAEGRLTLEKDRFYILATKERVSVPGPPPPLVLIGHAACDQRARQRAGAAPREASRRRAPPARPTPHRANERARARSPLQTGSAVLRETDCAVASKKTERDSFFDWCRCISQRRWCRSRTTLASSARTTPASSTRGSGTAPPGRSRGPWACWRCAAALPLLL